MVLDTAGGNPQADGKGGRMFLPPANLTDFNANLCQIWHKQMNNWFNDSIKRISQNKPNDWKCQFYNPAEMGNPAEEIPVPIPWTGFPRTLTTLYGADDALVKAEQLQSFGKMDAEQQTFAAMFDPDGNEIPLKYRIQDEYLEWRVERDPNFTDANGNPKIVRITFTCEGPEYWYTLAQHDRATLLQLYREYVDPAVEWNDLIFGVDIANKSNDGSLQPPTFQAGQYNPWNRWNTTHGIMHLSHPENTLTAEIQLGADGTVLRKGISKGISTEYLTESLRLTCCSEFGGPNRSSDPQIGSSVNKLAQLGAYVSLQIPVALYIDQWDPDIVTDVNGKPAPDSFFQVLRGDPGDPEDPNRPSRILRMEYAVPDHDPYVVGDLYVDGKQITSGGQLARHIHMKLIGTFFGEGACNNKPLDCAGEVVRLKNNDFLKCKPISTGAPDEGVDPMPRVNKPQPIKGYRSCRRRRG